MKFSPVDLRNAFYIRTLVEVLVYPDATMAVVVILSARTSLQLLRQGNGDEVSPSQLC